MDIIGIVFDLDGVIVSTDEFHYLAWKAIADQEKIPFDPVINNRLRGVGRMESLSIILEKAPREYSVQERLNLAEEKNKIYRNYLQRITPYFVASEVRETLETLKRNYLSLAVASGSKNAPLILDKAGLRPYFSCVIDGSMIIHSKPDPEVFLKAASGLGILPKNAIVVEDSDVGIEAAKKGGFFAAGISTAKNNPNADFHLSSFAELLRFSKR